jgi:hypothetical protein
MKDGGLRKEFRLGLPQYQWTSIETAGVSTGVPDSEFCSPWGKQGWIEFKRTHAYAVNITSFQVAWLMRRCRYGASAWIAVRRIPNAKKWEGIDELWFMNGDQADALFYNGLEGVHATCWGGGPGNWNFQEIHEIIHKGLTPRPAML